MKKVAIILLAIGLISCTLTKKDYKNDEPLPNLAKIKTPKEEAQEKAEEKLFIRIEEYRKLGILDGHLVYKNDYLKGLRYDIIIILISDKCRKIKNVKAYKKCSEKVLYKNGGIDYIDGNFTHFGCFNLKFNKNGDIDHIEEGVCNEPILQLLY